MQIQLRPYQLDLERGIKEVFRKGKKRCVLCLQTGGGKTFIFSYIVKSAIEKNPLNQVLILTHRAELLTQANGSLCKLGVYPELIKGSKRPSKSAQCFVAMHKTLQNRNYPWLNPSLIIIDEAHRLDFQWIFEKYPNAYYIGATATPIYSSTKVAMNQLFDSIVVGPQIRELIQMGALCPPEGYALKFDDEALKKSKGKDYTENELAIVFDTEESRKTVLENYLKHAKGLKTLAFCVSIQHAENLKDLFEANGVKSMVVHSKSENRQAVLNYLNSEPHALVFNVDILTTGFDCPSIEVIMVIRATKSLVLWLQMVGRGGRTSPNKTSFKYLDFGGNTLRLQAWEADRNWKAIFQNPKLSDSTGDAPVKECEACGHWNYAGVSRCVSCNNPFPVKEKNALLGELVQLSGHKCKKCGSEKLCQEEGEFGPHTIKVTCGNCGTFYKWGALVVAFKPLPPELKKPWSEMTVEELIERAKYGSDNTQGKPYKKGWIINQILKRANAEELLNYYSKLNNYKAEWVKFQLNKKNDTNS